MLTLAVAGQFAELEDLSDDTLEEHLITAEREALEARSRYLLRNKIVQSVLVTNPILKAVHGGANTSSAEQWVANRQRPSPPLTSLKETSSFDQRT